MRQTASFFLVTATLLTSPLSSPARGGELDLSNLGKAPSCSSCGKETYGTSIEWMGSRAEASREARKEEKLVFVLHVSGHFEDAAFT